MFNGKSRIFIGALISTTLAGVVFAGWTSRSGIVVSSGAVECYQVDVFDRPVSTSHFSGQKEIWCYRFLDKPKGTRLIYQVDAKGVTKPELSMLVEADGTIAHASLLKGELSVHRVRGFNPLNAPLTPPPGAKPVRAPISLAADTSVMNAIGVLQEVEFPELNAAIIEEGDYAASAAPEAMPWRGYWFPYSTARMYAGSASPLAKYDAFLRRRSGINPGSQSWESRHHYFSGVNWEGHCNGWAATSVLRKEPERSITDPYTGITFSISDLKALWIERDYCPKIAFFGSRYWGRAGNDPQDIYPHDFHNVLVHYIGYLKKPVLVDVMPDASVGNQVVSGYQMSVRQVGVQTYLVDAALTVHEYDNYLTDAPGVAHSVTRRYRYNLITNENGAVVSGRWLSSNPDFFWVPLASGNCEDMNEHVEEFWINEILKFDVKPPPLPVENPPSSTRPSPPPTG